MAKRRKKWTSADVDDGATSVIVSDEVDRDGMVSVMVVSPRGKFHYRVPAEPLAVQRGPRPSISPSLV